MNEIKRGADALPKGIPATADFRVVEHTADWAIRVRGEDFAELLLSAAWGMNSLLVADLEAVPLRVKRHLELTAFDRESMLVEWLSELAYLAERDGHVFREFMLHEVSAEKLRATVRGGKAPELLKHIKAVTFHNLQVRDTPNGLEATVVFDV